MKCELIDFMGSDDRVVDAARVSFDKEATNYSEEQNYKLIKYLATHDHWTPFAHVLVTVRETVPIFVARQRFKHTVGFTYNEVSRRYVDSEPEFFIPETWRKKAENRKQGSSSESLTSILHDYYDSRYSGLLMECRALYNSMVMDGVAPEQARMVLPQSMYTSYYCTGSLPAWSRAYLLRIDDHAQQEIQDLAKMWYAVIDSVGAIRNSWRLLTNTGTKSE